MLQQGKVRLVGNGGKVVPVRMVKPWNRDAMDSPSLEEIRQTPSLGLVCSGMILLEQGLD